jgi:hypothetical protein
MFNFMHPVSVFRRKPVAELTVRQAASYQAAAHEATAWLIQQTSTGDWSAQAPATGALAVSPELIPIETRAAHDLRGPDSR